MKMTRRQQWKMGGFLRIGPGGIGLIVLSAAIFFLLTAWSAHEAIRGQQAERWELTAERDAVSEPKQEEIAAIPGVCAVSQIIEVPVTMTLGRVEASITLYGMDPGYLNSELIEGMWYGEQSVIPYIVLNETALELFRDTDTGNTVQQAESSESQMILPDVVWEGVNTRLTGEKETPAKVCGILESEDGETPSGWISFQSAEALAGKSEMATFRVRLENRGVEQTVRNELLALGYMIREQEEEIVGIWEQQLRELGYIRGLALICLMWFCSICLIQYRVFSQIAAGFWQGIDWNALKKSEKRQIWRCRLWGTMFLAILAGGLLFMVFPYFCGEELREMSVWCLRTVR